MTLIRKQKSAGRDSSTLLIYKIQNILDWIDQFLKTWYSRLYENLKYTFLKMYRKRMGVIICQKHHPGEETENGMVRGLQIDMFS